MDIFCTYCSKEKNSEIEWLPAIHRYRNRRIRKISEAAISLGIDFFILSGEYGLIHSTTKIKYYDHLLVESEVGDLAKRVVESIKKDMISRVFFFHDSPIMDPNITPYLDVIKIACDIAGIELRIIQINVSDDGIPSKNGYRTIWYRAIAANQVMVVNGYLDGKPFLNLLNDHPTDGMIFYERGEAYECLGELEKAKDDYENAIVFFPNPKWKNVAYEGLKRIQNATSSYEKRCLTSDQWNYFHKVHTLVLIPHDIRTFVLSAIERYEEEQRLSISELRIALEMVFRLIYTHNRVEIQDLDNINFCNRVTHLQQIGVIDQELSNVACDCWRFMGEIIHPIKYQDVKPYLYDKILAIFIRVMELCNRDCLK